MTCPLCAVVFLICAAMAGAAENQVFYVAVDGNDAWSGRMAAANAGRTDGPLATLTGARDAIRRARATAGNIGAVTVQVRRGVYRLESAFVLEPQDSGTAQAPVVFEAYQGEHPVFSGGRVIGGFRQNGNLWEAEIPQAKAGQWYFRQLFVDGQRRGVARSPNSGYHRIAKLIPGPPIPNAKPVAREKFIFAPGDIKPYSRLGDVRVVLMHSWETSIHPLKSVDEQTHTVEFAAPMKEWWCIGYWEDAQRYYVENALELLDTPGEWYLNRESGVLSYWPMPGEKLGQTQVVAPVLGELVRLAGNADQGQFVQHVTLRGLAFQHADWQLDPKGNSSTQAAVDVPAVITADGAINCAFEACEVAHVGTYGVWFRRGCKDCRIQRNHVYNLGAGGIRVGEANMAKTDVAETSRTLVDNNHIHAGGRVYAGCVGLWLAQSSHNTISHNDIHDLYYTGISVGWNWGLTPDRTHDNIVEFNHVHDLGHGVLSDCGLIYCLGVSPGSVIRNNVFHDIWPYSQPALGWGIYLDAQTGNYTVENNLVYNTLSGGLMFNNGGHEHVIQNNIFALSANQALWPYSEKRPSTFRHNITYLTQGSLLIAHGERSLNERLAAKESPGDWNDNIYWHTGGAEALRFYRRTFAEWQGIGLDTRSRIADPLFANPAAHDFALKPESPAGAHVSGERNGASIRVSDERAASGRQSLKITDSKALQPSWEPHFYYEPHMTSGVVRQSFDVWFAPDAQFFTEWRDTADYPKNVGPSVRFDGSGKISAAGKLLAEVPSKTWIHVEIEAGVGKSAPRTYKITITPVGGQPLTHEGLPIGGADFHELHWLGFSSTAAADTVYFVDNLRVVQPR